ncbi:MAG: hypothetical protein ABW090_01165 [Sedimenticola sp.]
MYGRLLGLGFLMFVQVGCGSGYYPPDQLHRSVKPHSSREGVYLVYYRRHQVIDEYGPGVERVREAIRNNPDNWRALWDKAAAEAVTRYMEDKGLIPSECQNGIVVINSYGDEAGGGTTAFRCK